MVVALTWHAYAALAGEGRDPWVEAAAQEPMLEWAEVDIRAARRTRFAIAVSVTAPGLFFVGGVAARSFADSSQSGYVVGVGLTAVGAVGSTLGPLLLFYDVERSRAALRAQGLSMRNTRTWISAPLWAASVGTIGTLAVAHGGSFDEHRAGVVVGVSCYAGGLVVGIADAAVNHAARRDAGWVALVPLLDKDIPGVALVGSM